MSTNKAKKLRGHVAPNSSTETYPICDDPSSFKIGAAKLRSITETTPKLRSHV